MMPGIKVAGNISLRRPRPIQGCRADGGGDDDDDETHFKSRKQTQTSSIH